MDEATCYQKLLDLNARLQTQWDSDVAALRAHAAQQEQLSLQIADLCHAVRERWSAKKLPDLAREAGLSVHTLRKYAHVAQRIPIGSPLRSMGLPYSILRLLAPLADPEPWAERARALHEAGDLHVRDFAALLVQAGLRHPRPRRVPRCPQCNRAIDENVQPCHVRRGECAAWLCSTRCGIAYLSGHRPHPLAREPKRSKDSWREPPPPAAPPRDSESHVPPPAQAPAEPHGTASPAPAPGRLAVMTPSRPNAPRGRKARAKPGGSPSRRPRRARPAPRPRHPRRPAHPGGRLRAPPHA